MTTKHQCSLAAALLGGTVMVTAWPGSAAEVTPQRLANPEPQNWLMNHRTYDAQRYSPLERINRDNVKNLKLAYSVAIGGTSVNEPLHATPLAEDGFYHRPQRQCRCWGLARNDQQQRLISSLGQTRRSPRRRSCSAQE